MRQHGPSTAQSTAYPFDTQTGAAQRGPARTVLTKYSVTMDNQSQIIYG